MESGITAAEIGLLVWMNKSISCSRSERIRWRTASIFSCPYRLSETGYQENPLYETAASLIWMTHYTRVRNTSG